MQLKTVITANRLSFKNEDGKDLAVLDFVEKDGVISITHTGVDELLRGKGMAGKLMEEFYNHVKKEGKKVKPICSYAVAWFEKRSENCDVLAD